MSFQHHNEGMSDDLRKLFEDEKASLQRFKDQVTGCAKRTWSDGRIGATDDGDLAFMVGPHPERELVIVDFGKQVQYVAMPPQQAMELASCLIKHARAITTTPISLTIP